jgi:hypothetical protein
MDAKLGGYPTPLDVGYPFEYGARKPLPPINPNTPTPTPTQR